VIDIDRYGIPLEQMMAHVRVSLPVPLPLVPMKTKSGGWHLFLFLKEPAASDGIYTLANKIRFWLNGGPLALNAGGKGGKAEIEIRPAQPMINAADGDTGNFVTVPLFNSTPEEQEAFLAMAETQAISIETLRTLTDEGDLSDGPCCLFPIQKKAEDHGWHQRNLFIYQLAVFYKKKFPSDWKQRVQDYAKSFIGGSPAVTPQEIEKTCSSIERTNPHFICDKDPFEGVCNKALCTRRRYGVASRGVLEFVNLDGLIVIDSDPPVWHLTVRVGEEDLRMRLETSQLQNQKSFKKRCIEVMKTIPELPGPKEWEAFVNSLLAQAQVIPVPYEMSDEARLWDLIWRFYSSNAVTTQAEEVLTGKIYVESTPDSGSIAYFRLIDFTMYLERVRAKLPPTSLYALLKEMEMRGKVKVAVVLLEGPAIEVWSAPIPEQYLLTKMEANERRTDGR
jgi:hypothetical protein